MKVRFRFRDSVGDKVKAIRSAIANLNANNIEEESKFILHNLESLSSIASTEETVAELREEFQVAANEELKELFLQFDLSGINEALSERLGFEVSLKAYVKEKPRVNRYSLYDETDHSKDTSFMDTLFTKLTIGTFSGGWSEVNSHFWFGIDIFYSAHGGGSNGVKFAELKMYPDGEYNLTFNKDKYK